jgi:hypothetical protein
MAQLARINNNCAISGGAVFFNGLAPALRKQLKFVSFSS